MEHNSLDVWFRSCSFLNGRFVGSMLIFQGVCPKEGSSLNQSYDLGMGLESFGLNTTMCCLVAVFENSPATLGEVRCLKRSSMMCHVKNRCLRYDPEVPCG